MRALQRARNLLVCVLAVGTAITTYIFLGTSGYLTFGDKVAHDILANYPSKNGIVAVARFAISFVVMCCYPLNHYPARMAIYSLLFSASPPVFRPR